MANQQINLGEENGNALVATAIVFLALSWFSVVLRTYTRAFLMKSFQADDWLMLIGQVFHICLLPCVSLFTHAFADHFYCLLRIYSRRNTKRIGTTQ